MRTLDGGSKMTYELAIEDDIPFFQRMGSVIPVQNSALRTRLLTDSFRL
jgi:alpha-glucosidase (family GH31 glycosyl hydrolase)